MLHQTFKKNRHTKKQQIFHLFLLVTSIVLFIYQQHLAYGQQYVIVDSENGDRLTGIWRGGTGTHFEIEYQGEILRLPVKGHRLSFTSDLSNVADRTAAKYFENGLMLLEFGLPEKAKSRFEAAIEEFPKYPEAHYQLGLLYKANGDNRSALERFRSVAILDAANFDLVPHFRELGDAALAGEAYGEAVENYQLILKYYPDHESVSGLSYITGFLLVEQLENYDEGLVLLELARQQYPDMLSHEKAVFLIGKLQAQEGQLENALHTLRGFVLRYPLSEWVYEAHLIHAEVNLKLGNVKEAGNEAAQVHNMSVDETVKERAKQILDQTRWTVYTVAEHLPDNRVQAIAVDGTQLWVGTPNGVMLFETAFDNWIPLPEDVPQLINSSMETVPDVRSIAVNSDDVWLGTRSQGAIHYNKSTGEIQGTYTLTDGSPAWVKDIKIDDTEVWFATDGGVVRKIRGTVDPPVVYNRQQSFIQADNIETLLVTSTTVWCASADGAVVTFNRETEEWSVYNSTEMRKGMTVAGFDTAEDQLLFTWFNTDEQTNGYFRADLDGLNGKSTTIETGVEDENDLRNIYIRGALDDSPVIVAENEAPSIETPEPLVDEAPLVAVPDPLTSEFSPETEALEIQPLPPPTPLVLWIATNDLFYTHHTRSGEWADTTTPRIVAGELIIHAFVVGNGKVWIATNNGLAAMNVQ